MDTSNLPHFLVNPDPELLYGSNNYLTVDFETDTSGGTYGSAVVPENGLLLACWKRGPEHPDGPGSVSHWGSEFEMQELVDAIEKADFVVAHNAKYELMWLKRCGLPLTDVLVFDTKIAEYVLLGNLAAGDERMIPISTSLGACAKRRGMPAKDPVVDILMSRGINPVAMPQKWLQGRCERDVWETEEIFLQQRRALSRSKRLGVMLTRCLLTPVLSALEFEGMCLDPEVVEETYAEYRAKFAELSREMNDFTGGINWRSSKQSADFLYNDPNPVPGLAPGLGFAEIKKFDGSPRRTKPSKLHPEGQRMTDKKSLEKLVAKTKRQKDFIALRAEIGRINAALTKSLEFFIGIVREKGGTFHAEFNQTRTSTHRLSSKGITQTFEMFEDRQKTAQFQNLARVFKKLFKAKQDGWLMAEADGSQLEFRVAAFLGNDTQAKADISSGHDVHRFTASVLNDIDEAEVNKLQRQDAKADTFKPLYGGTSGSPAQQQYYKAFRERYPELAHTQEQWVYDVLTSHPKRLATSWGLRYYFPYAHKSKTGWCNVTSSVYNYPVQALATAEIIPIALVYFWHRVRAAGLHQFIRIVNTVHDSVICELHPDYVEQFKELAIQSFTHDVYEYLDAVYDMEFDVPLGTGITTGSHWSIGDEESYNVDRQGNVEKVA